MPALKKTSGAEAADKNLITDDPDKLPPYGYMNDAWMYDVRTRRVPVRFRLGGGDADEAEFQAWLEKNVNEMANYLWPQWKDGKWHGKARDTAWALTEADLNLMDTALRGKLRERVACRSQEEQGTHAAFFEAEDLNSPIDTLAKYDPAISAPLMIDLKKAMTQALVDFGPAPLRFKQCFQRPRPYQTAFLLNRPFTYEWGKSAVSPSLISGHCVQAMVAGGNGYVKNLRRLGLIAGAEENLMQWTVDAGDRRVFAGVHYPSDNVSSWIIALTVSDNYVFGELGNEAKAFLSAAIRRSLVYQAIESAVKADPKSPFALPTQRLHALMV
jgi:hypothetical protein